MSHNELSDQDKVTLSRCLTDGVEPPAELAKKLFPSVCGTWDVAKLNRASIPTIEYAGKRSEAAILNEAAAFGAGSPLQIVRFFQGGKLKKDAQQLELLKETGPTWETGWKNMIVQGDNLQFLKTCYLNQDPLIKDKVKGKVNLFYIDPPFATKTDFEGGEGEDSYSDKIDRSEFLESLRERFIFMKEVLAVNGTIFVHIDQKMAHYVKVILDEVFGKERLLNELVWKRTPFAGSSKARSKRFPINHDLILWYSKSPDYYFETQYEPYTKDYIARFKNPDKDPRGPWQSVSLKTYSEETFKQLEKDRKLIPAQREGAGWRYKWFLSETKGKQIEDLWTDLNLTNPMAAERTDYPTQKPEVLLERVIRSCSSPGDLVMDIFGGSGTTAAVAEKLDRRWITCDFGKHAIYTMQARIASISNSYALKTTTPINPERLCELCSNVIAESQHFKKCKKCGAFIESDSKIKQDEYDKPPRDFCVVSVGAFDFAKIMDLRKNADAYVAFVLGVFGITERSVAFAQKYHISNVVAEKDGHPVEVYPVWEEDYLRKVRVDMDYLKGIMDQSGRKLKGNYYIISPESCVRVGAETVLKNAKGEKVTFRMLTFPYKVLEEAARNFQLSEQPSSSDNINQLISSVGFYFNEEVEIKVKKTSKGFKVTAFSTTILNAGEQRYEGLDGLAMILVDTGYDGETFNVDACVYQKDIKDDEVTLKGINGKTAIIAVDKHGNESKVTLVK